MFETILVLFVLLWSAAVLSGSTAGTVLEFVLIALAAILLLRYIGTGGQRRHS